jgi:hypothetical protein
MCDLCLVSLCPHVPSPTPRFIFLCGPHPEQEHGHTRILFILTLSPAKMASTPPHTPPGYIRFSKGYSWTHSLGVQAVWPFTLSSWEDWSTSTTSIKVSSVELHSLYSFTGFLSVCGFRGCIYVSLIWNWLTYFTDVLIRWILLHSFFILDVHFSFSESLFFNS